MICTLFRKPLNGGGILQSLPCATLNIDRTRVPHKETLAKMSGKSILGGTSDGWNRPWKVNPVNLARRQASADEAIDKANILGRWGANVLVTNLTIPCMESQFERSSRFFKAVTL